MQLLSTLQPLYKLKVMQHLPDEPDMMQDLPHEPEQADSFTPMQRFVTAMQRFPTTMQRFL